MNVPLIISNHCDLEEIAKDFKAKFFYISSDSHHKLDIEKKILNQLKIYDIKFAVLAKYMQILSDSFLQDFSTIINIHHSFLPAFKGSQPYHRAWDRGVKIIGATAHYVTEDLDEGPIIEQSVERVDHTHTPDQLVAVGRDIENVVLARGLQAVLEDRVLLNGIRTVIL